MTSAEIIKLLDILIGRVEATGNEVADEQIEKNLMKLIDVVNDCLDSVMFAAETRHNLGYSERRIGERAFTAMTEWMDWLSEQVNG